MIRILLAATLTLCLVGTASAVRVLADAENSVELALSDVQLPAFAADAVTFRTCAECRSFTRRTSEATRYYLNGGELPLADLRAEVEKIRVAGGAKSTLVGVFYDLKTEQVTRIVLHYRAR